MLRLFELALRVGQQGSDGNGPGGRRVRASTFENLSQVGQLPADALSESELQPATLGVRRLEEPPTGRLELIEMPTNVRL